MKIKLKGCTGETFVKRAFKLLYDACGYASGIGAFQAVDEASEDAIWKRAYERGDYPGGNMFGDNKPGKVYGDYVFGRMIKWGCEWTEDAVEMRDFEFARDYQGFSRVYRDNAAIVKAVAESLGVEFVVLS